MDFLLSHIKEIMLIFFFAIFAGIMFWAYRPANKIKMKSYGDIPFKEDEEEKHDR